MEEKSNDDLFPKLGGKKSLDSGKEIVEEIQWTEENISMRRESQTKQ